MNVGDGARGFAQPIRSAERIVVRIGQINSVVRHQRALGGAGLGRSNVHAAPDLHAVSHHNFAAARNVLRKPQRKRAFARGGFAGDHNCFALRVCGNCGVAFRMNVILNL